MIVWKKKKVTRLKEEKESNGIHTKKEKRKKKIKRERKERMKRLWSFLIKKKPSLSFCV